jgi:C4-dicarboxylate-specific signal transduction histidine kinase
VSGPAHDVVAESASAETETRERARRHLSLGQWLFLLLLLFLVVPLCGSSFWGYYQSRKYLIEASFRDLRNIASLEASDATQYVEHAESLFSSAVLADRRLANLARRLNHGDQAALPQARDELRALQRKLTGLLSVEEVRLVSPTGILLAATLDRRGAGPALDGPTCMPVSAAGPVIAGVWSGKDGAGVLFADAIESGDDERLGAICARVRFDFGRRLLRARRNRMTEGALYLLNGRGDVVGDSFAGGDRAGYGRPFGSGRVIPALDRPWQGRSVLDSGAEALAAYEPIPALDWGVLVEEPAAVALASAQHLEWQAGAAAVALLLLAAAAAVFGWRTVVNPLRSLSRTAERMASGATGETVTPAGARETADLARAFNRMSVALKESQDSLERRIRQRTHELRESQDFAELLLNSIDHRVIALDRQYRIVKANAAALRMYGPDLVGMQCHRIFEGRSEPCEDCAAARTFATGLPASEERSENTGGGREAVEVETYPVAGVGGEINTVIEIARIVTTEKQVQMQMMHQQKMAAFGLLAAGMAHDIGNPLAAIESQLQVARQQPDRHGETLDVVSKEISRISRMLRELIDFTRRRRDAVMLVSVNQVVEDVVRLLSHDPRARTVSVASRLAAKLPGVRTTEDHLFQVLLNLGLNGLDAMSEGGTLEFETSGRSGWVVLRVRDTGHGIRAEDREHLFEPFFTTKAPGRGSGLGLFVSKSIVEGMGGDLSLEHTDGRGTVFAIFLPVVGGAEDGVAA